jgi:PAS domain S-box-containing protein
METGGGAPVGSNPRLVGLVLAFALLAAFSSAPSAAAAPEKTRLVVVLYPDVSDGTGGVGLIDHGIRATLAAGSPDRVEVANEYVDTSHFRDAAFRQAQKEYLRQKYAGRKIDLVLAALASGLDFALENREVFPGVPVVFFAVDQRELSGRKLRPDVTGIPINIDPTATLDLALRLHPGTRHVVVIAGSSKFDAYWEGEARRAFRPYEDRVEFEYLSGLPMDDLLERVAALPEHTVVYYLHVFRDGTGKAFVPADALERLSAKANAPVYGHSDTYVGKGAVGGRVVSLEDGGKAAARLGLRILAGENPESVPTPPPAENTYRFDWRQMRRWGIGEQGLPQGSIVLFKEPDFWELYRWHALGVVSLCVVQTLLILGLLVQRANWKRAEARFRQAVEAAPNGMLMIGRDGVIVLANAQVERLFGYAKEELLGQPVEMLVPEQWQAGHPALRRDFFAAPQARLVGGGRELFGRRKDGGEFPVEIGLSPVRNELGLFVLASVIDLTERRRAEQGLRASQDELRVLTGRLLQAQETERRRIARELHDDLNQGLALLAVELDLLGRNLPESVADARERVQQLAGRVKLLSSSVHDLSHQLHPSKLEQLGLVAALRALCRELSSSHGVPLEFTHHEVPGGFSEDAGLCLYRIAQEALGNVIKHSKARRAAVELTAGADGVCLRVSDDGAGFDPGQVAAKGGLGLVSMRERLRLVGGTLSIESEPAGGTRIVVRVPSSAAGGTDGDLNRPSPVVRSG